MPIITGFTIQENLIRQKSTKVSNRNNLMDTTDKIFETIQKAGEPVNAGKIVELSGIDRKEVDKAMKKLKTSGRITSPKNCYWEPAK